VLLGIRGEGYKEGGLRRKRIEESAHYWLIHFTGVRILHSEADFR